MFSTMRRLLNKVLISQSATHITIEGIRGYAIERDIRVRWGTSRIRSHMFSMFTTSKVRFHNFFAIDVLYMFEELAKTPGTYYGRGNYHKMVELLKEHTWLSSLEKDILPSEMNWKAIENIKFPLLEHQCNFIHHYDTVTRQYRLKGALLAAAPGTGKTITAIALGLALQADVTIVICPKNAVNRVWEMTIANDLKHSNKYWVSTSNYPPPLNCNYYIYHYEALEDALHFFQKNRFYKKPFIVLDESHNFNEVTSLRTQRFEELCISTKCENILEQSGTPIKSMGAESIPIFRVIDSFFNPLVEAAFKKIFGKDAKAANDILRNRLGIISFKVDKSTVVSTGLTEQDIPVVIPNANTYTLDSIKRVMTEFVLERTIYYDKHFKEFKDFYNKCLSIHEKWCLHHGDVNKFNQYKKDVEIISKGYDPVAHKEIGMRANFYELKVIIPSLPQELRKEFKSVRSIIKYVKLKIMGEALGNVLGRYRIDCNVDLVPFINLEKYIDDALKKTIIFTNHTDVVDAANDYLIKKGYNPVIVYGDTNKDLKHIVEAFEQDPDINPLIATYKSLSTAVPLVMANNIILIDAPFREYEKDQAISRANRKGQDTDVTVWNVFLDTGETPNISTRSKDILQWSKEQVASILGIKVDSELDTSMEDCAPSLEQLEEQAKELVTQLKQKHLKRIKK